MELTEGQIVLISFPYSDSQKSKLRPALLLKKLPGGYNDWLICSVSTKLFQEIKSFDLIITSTDDDFVQTGLKQNSLLRISRLAVVNQSLFQGICGNISNSILKEILKRLANWIGSNDT
jgi:mRNA interferase MazF